MEKLSVSQKWFSFCAVLLSALFFYELSHAISQKSWSTIGFLAPFYALLMFLNGLYFGRRDSVVLSRADIGFRYHGLTYLSVNAIYGLTLFIPGFWSDVPLEAVVGQFIFWGFGLGVHYLSSRKTIKGYDPEEIF